MSLNGLECQASKVVDSDACPRPATGLLSGLQLVAMTFSDLQINLQSHLGGVALPGGDVLQVRRQDITVPI